MTKVEKFSQFELRVDRVRKCSKFIGICPGIFGHSKKGAKKYESPRLPKKQACYKGPLLPPPNKNPKSKHVEKSPQTSPPLPPDITPIPGFKIDFERSLFLCHIKCFELQNNLAILVKF